jgi:hypothetical protein
VTRPTAGTRLPDVTLPDSDGVPRRLADLRGGEPLLLHTDRGWFCPKERAYLRQVLLPLQEVGYVRMVSAAVRRPRGRRGDARGPAPLFSTLVAARGTACSSRWLHRHATRRLRVLRAARSGRCAG